MGTFTPSVLVFVIVNAMILSGMLASRYAKEIQRVREISAIATCQTLRQEVLENKITPERLGEFTEGRYFPGISADSITIDDVSHLYCGEIDMRMDPIETIPGLRNLYANFTDKMARGRYSVER
jgi:hypothetical protein